jgi:acyl-CoA thioester hydrolase
MVRQYRVYYEDTDAGGVVYHANYLKFAERARTEMLRSIDINQSDINNYFFVVKNIEVDFIKAAKLDDLIEVHTSIITSGATYIDFLQNMKVENNDICKIQSKVVFVQKIDDKMIPKRMPEYIKKLM